MTIIHQTWIIQVYKEALKVKTKSIIITDIQISSKNLNITQNRTLTGGIAYE